MVKKEEHLPTVWKQSPSGEDCNLAAALSYPTVNKSTIEELKQVLRLLFVKVGLRANNLPNDDEKQVLIDHIINHYGNHTPQEIRLAFEMAVTDKLDLEHKDVVCYENFSCLYFSKIMTSYRKWATEAYQQIKMEQRLALPDRSELDPIEMLDWIKDWKEKPITHVDLIPLCFYDFLTTTESIIVNSEMKWDYWNKALTSIGTELHNATGVCKTTDALKELSAFEKMKTEGLFTQKMKNRIENKAKKLILFDYFRKK